MSREIELIELTETWAARITLCGNAETLGVDNDTAWGLTDKEAVNAIVDAGQQVVTEWAADCSAADVDSFFPAWNGGKHYSATYRCWGVAAELYHRGPDAAGEDDLTYSDWEWAGTKETPAILADGIIAIIGRISDAMEAAKSQMEAHAAEEEAKFQAEQPTD